MAIIPNLCYSVDKSTDYIYLTDETGVYSVNNEGGYGTPNNDRADYAGVLYAAYTDSKSGENPIEISSVRTFYDENYLNTEESKFTTLYKNDGWYKFVYSLIPTSNTAENGNIRYNVSTETLQIYEDTEWVELTDFSLIDNPTQFPSVKLELLLFAKLKLKYNNLQELYNECTFGCSNCDCSDIQQNVLDLRIFLESASARFDSNKRNQAQIMIERLTQKFS